MTRTLALLASFALVLLPLLVHAQQADVSGRWTTPVSDTVSAVFDLKADGQRLTGNVGQNGNRGPEIANGRIEGDAISFSIQVQGRMITFAGKVRGDEIEFTRKVDVAPGADPGGPGIYGSIGLERLRALRRGADPALAELEGTVVRSGSNDPVANATVELRSSTAGRGYPNLGVGPSVTGALLLTAVTDRDGKFLFPETPVGTYRLHSVKDGYPRTAGMKVSTTAGKRLTADPIAMTPGGIISGHVTTTHGQPAANASVVVFRASYNDAGQRILTEALSWFTDDLGDYKIGWLAPGRYYVAASVGTAPSQVLVNPDEDSAHAAIYASGPVQIVQVTQPNNRRKVLQGPAVARPDESYVVTYYPNTPDLRRANVVDVQSGGEAPKINIDASPLPVRHVRGHVTGALAGPGGAPLPVSLQLIHVGLRSAISAQADSNGDFDIPVAIQGAYVLLATVGQLPTTAGARGGQRGAGARGAIPAALLPAGPLTGRADFEVGNGDVTGIDLSLMPALRLSGNIEIESLLTDASFGVGGLSIVLRPEPALPGFPNYTVAPATAGRGALNASFSDLVVPVGDYRVLIGPMPANPSEPIAADLQNTFKTLENTYVKSITFGGVDVLKNDLHLTEQPKDSSLRVVIGTKPGALKGRVVRRNPQASAGATVVLIPEDAQRFRIRHKFVTTDTDGNFQLVGIAPGAYKLFAWEDVERFAWQDPDFVSSYENFGKTISIAAGDNGPAEIIAIPSKP